MSPDERFLYPPGGLRFSSIGACLRHYRMRAGDMTRAELSRLTGVDVSYIRRIEEGEVATPSFPMVSSLALALGADMTDLANACLPAGSPRHDRPRARVELTVGLMNVGQAAVRGRVSQSMAGSVFRTMAEAAGLQVVGITCPGDVATFTPGLDGQ